jgi:hypothetical protein
MRLPTLCSGGQAATGIVKKKKKRATTKRKEERQEPGGHHGRGTREVCLMGIAFKRCALPVRIRGSNHRVVGGTVYNPYLIVVCGGKKALKLARMQVRAFQKKKKKNPIKLRQRCVDVDFVTLIRSSFSPLLSFYGLSNVAKRTNELLTHTHTHTQRKCSSHNGFVCKHIYKSEIGR